MSQSEAEGVRLLRMAKEREGLKTEEVAARFGYTRDGYHRLCRYEFEPKSEAAGKIGVFIGMPRAWVMDHWATEVHLKKRKKSRMRRAS
jgi:hypothetical protein